MDTTFLKRYESKQHYSVHVGISPKQPHTLIKPADTQTMKANLPTSFIPFQIYSTEQHSAAEKIQKLQKSRLPQPSKLTEELSHLRRPPLQSLIGQVAAATFSDPVSPLENKVLD